VNLSAGYGKSLEDDENDLLKSINIYKKNK
jgi:hypothetical protein